MINALRKKFIIINMFMVFVVLFMVFSAMAVTNIRKTKMDTEMFLQSTLGGRGIAARAFPAFEIGGGAPIEFMRVPTFLVTVYSNGMMQLSIPDDITISDEMLAEIINTAQDNGNMEGELRAYNLKYIKRYENDTLKIAYAETTKEKEQIAHTLLMALVMLAGSMAAFFAVSLYLSKWALRPVEKAWEQQRRFVSDASHELKTPLTVILANVGILKSKENETIASQIKWINNTKDEATRMKELVDSLLFLAKSDDVNNKTVFEEMNFSDIVFNICLSMESVAFEKGISIDISNVESDISIDGSKEQIKRLVMIIMDNAIKYSNEQGEIPVSLSKESGKAVLTIKNTGAHLGEDEIAHIFDRFYRADESRSEEGYGLGLSIAKSIVESHSGEISTASLNGSTIMKIVLPVKNA